MDCLDRRAYLDNLKWNDLRKLAKVHGVLANQKRVLITELLLKCEIAVATAHETPLTTAERGSGAQEQLEPSDRPTKRKREETSDIDGGITKRSRLATSESLASALGPARTNCDDDLTPMNHPVSKPAAPQQETIGLTSNTVTTPVQVDMVIDREHPASVAATLQDNDNHPNMAEREPVSEPSASAMTETSSRANPQFAGSMPHPRSPGDHRDSSSSHPPVDLRLENRTQQPSGCKGKSRMTAEVVERLQQEEMDEALAQELQAAEDNRIKKIDSQLTETTQRIIDGICWNRQFLNGDENVWDAVSLGLRKFDAQTGTADVYRSQRSVAHTVERAVSVRNLFRERGLILDPNSLMRCRYWSNLLRSMHQYLDGRVGV